MLKKILLLISVAALFSCSPNYQEIKLKAIEIGHGNGMESKTYQTKNFKIFTLLKNTDPKKPLRVYIEGDGRAFINKYTPSQNPTPLSFFLLNLVKEDDYPNILYIARACQFSEDDKCQEKYWTIARFSPEAVDSIAEVLQNFSKQKIELIGYSGGGAIAKLIAQKNSNIANLRTIAGNLDHQKFTEIHRVPALSKSAPDFDLQQLAKIPQIHFVGADDKIVPEIIAKSYEEKLPQKNCSEIMVIKNATHSQGWSEVWPQLLQKTPNCRQ